MYIRKNRSGAKCLIGILIVLCLTILSAQALKAQEYGLGDIPLHPDVYQRHMKVWPKDMVIALPSVYDARDDGIVTSAKNQGSCGSCWAFASVGAIESHLLKINILVPLDLSEQQQVSCNLSMSGCCGGSASAIRFWENTGPIYETCFTYGEAGTSCSTGQRTISCSNSAGCPQLNYRVTDWHTVGQTTDDFKASLYNYGPSYWRFNVYDDFFDFWNYGNQGDVYINQPGSMYQGGHAVLLIGWDDEKGAYLCKNSWGSSRGPNDDGTFWIAYTGHWYNLSFAMSNFSIVALGCGNGTCEADEDRCTCAQDCGKPPAAEAPNSTCVDGVDNDCDGSADCADIDCSADPACGCDNDGICDKGENCSNCPNDCIGGTGGTCADCFKGVCNGECHSVKEGPACADCAPGYCCGDGVCEGIEDVSNCAIDCVISCKSDADCNDYNDCTSNKCENSVCKYTAVANDMPCSGGLCCGGECVPPACTSDAGCKDAEICTTDKCLDMNTCAAKCEHSWPVCGGASDGCCGPMCGAQDPDCKDCSDCSGGICDGRCHKVKDGPNCPDCASG